MENFDIKQQLVSVASHLANAGDGVQFTIVSTGLDITVEAKVGPGRIVINCGHGYSLAPLEAIAAISQGEESYAASLPGGDLAVCAWHMAKKALATLELGVEAIYVELYKGRSTALTLATFEGKRQLVAEFANSDVRLTFPAAEYDSYETYLNLVTHLYCKIQNYC